MQVFGINFFCVLAVAKLRNKSIRNQHGLHSDALTPVCSHFDQFWVFGCLSKNHHLEKWFKKADMVYPAMPRPALQQFF